MRVLGTAGHVDHGKSTLVEALTGIDPDRLKEEKARQMTIDLGFAWLTLPSGSGLGIVDVPGHLDFIENMLAGVGGIDAAMLVVAADEGIMPQTREHLAVLDLLQIPQLVVALTKVDLVSDPDQPELLKLELEELLATTRYAGAPQVEVSAPASTGMDQLLQAIDDAVAASPERDTRGLPRLPVDRAFSISGFGTVVTGTLLDGELEVGQAVEIQPANLKARIRGLQTHRQPIERALPGSRVAINLSGVAAEQIGRGEVVARPGSDRGTRMLDARLQVLRDSPVGLRHNMQLKLFCGAARRSARLRILAAESIEPGESGWGQLLVDVPVAIRRGDRLILRRASPSATLAGGQIADPFPSRRHRRNDLGRIRQLERLLHGSAGELLMLALQPNGTARLPDAAVFVGLPLRAAASLARRTAQDGSLVILNPERPQAEWELLSGDAVGRAEGAVRRSIAAYHERHPTRIGMPREELRSRHEGLTETILGELLRRAVVAQHGTRIALPDFTPHLTTEQQVRIDSLVERFERNPGRPPSVAECLDAVGGDLYSYSLDRGLLIQVSDAVVFEARQYARMIDQLEQLLREQGSATVSQIRIQLDTSRKYAMALLAHLDAAGVTYRDGDERKLVRPATG